MSTRISERPDSTLSSSLAGAARRGAGAAAHPLRAGVLLGAILLAGCEVPLPDKAAQAAAKEHRAAMASDEGRIVCSPPGTSEFAPVCTVDRVQSQDGLFLTLRHPDGGFRRLLVTRDGRGVVAADGAEPALVIPRSETEIEVALGGARYRLPATVNSRALP